MQWFFKVTCLCCIFESTSAIFVWRALGNFAMADFEENVEEMVGTTREAAGGDRVRRGRERGRDQPSRPGRGVYRFLLIIFYFLDSKNLCGCHVIARFSRWVMAHLNMMVDLKIWILSLNLALRTSEAGIPAARYVNARRQKSVYRLYFLMRTGTGMPES